jgi:hypothetical protein
MARKGDIDSKTVASRVPMDTYISLLRQSSKEKMTISAYVSELLKECISFGRPVQKPYDPSQFRADEYKALYEKAKEDYNKITFERKELKDRISQLEEELSKFRKI